MELSEQDQEFLELTTLKVPWYMVCGDLHHQFDSVEALAERLIELRDAGFITNLPSGEDAEEVSPSGLIVQESANDNYEEFDSNHDSSWEFMTTQTGFAAVKKRLSVQ